MADSKKPKSYQQMNEELNGLIEWFDGDKIDLDQAIDKYQQAMELLQQMEKYLKTAENKVKKISLKFDNG